MGTENEMSTNGQSSSTVLSTVDPDDIVYADESGMDHRDEYDYAYGPKGERVYALKIWT